jgi:hypothetical protein
MSNAAEAFKRLRKQYAEFCAAYADEDEVDGFYRLGFEQFPLFFYPDPRFPDDPQCNALLIDEHHQCLIIQSTLVTLNDVPIGEFAINIKPWPREERSFRCFNLTKRIPMGENSFADHPHVYDGVLCSSGKDAIMLKIGERDFLEASRFILRALNTKNAGHYRDSKEWVLAPQQIIEDD